MKARLDCWQNFIHNRLLALQLLIVVLLNFYASQNLPKPNVPGQTNDQGQANPSAKVTSVFPKTTPGISSREKPAGRPPAKPTLTPNQPLTQPGDLSQSQTISPIASATSSPNYPAQDGNAKGFK